MGGGAWLVFFILFQNALKRKNSKSIRATLFLLLALYQTLLLYHTNLQSFVWKYFMIGLMKCRFIHVFCRIKNDFGRTFFKFQTETAYSKDKLFSKF